MIKYPVYQPVLSSNVKSYVNECIDSNWISSRGKFVDLFENEFCKYIDAKHSITVSNGTVALHLALLALEIGEGDEVIVPSFTYIASVNAIRYVNAVPVFVDCNPDDWQMSLDDVEQKITSKTKAIMAVHLYGGACNVSGLLKIARNNNLFLVEDAAESFGTLSHGIHVGTLSDVATFSFFGNKTITTGEGGMVVTNNDQYATRIRKLRGQGLQGKIEYWHDEIGYNYRMTNICAAIGLAQLETADMLILAKRKIADLYKQYLKPLPVHFLDESPGVKSSFWMNTIQVESSEIRDKLRTYLSKNGVETRPAFYPAHTMPMYVQYAKGDYPVSESIASKGINLPSSPALKESDIEQICNLIGCFFKGEVL